ncbi:IS1634 family transposase [Candidatus Woesearchaeota archaeon]|nr:IS1634 family transposase [Candidatus Woesearchaeota archaeon]
MSFIRKIKNGKYTYLAEVENRWVNGKVVQKHIRYVGKELNGKRILSGSIANTDVTGVKIWAPLIVLNKLAKQINLSEFLGDCGDYLLSMVYAHCLDPKSVNKMEDWFVRTDLHNILRISDVSEEKLYNSLDSIDERNFNVIQKKIFRSVIDVYNLQPKGYFFDVTNVYFYGVECPIAKKGHNKEKSHHPQVQIGLAVTKEEGIPIFHKTFDGNIFDARTLQDFLVEFHDLNIEDVTIVWDRGVTSENNISDAQKAGFEVICGLAIKQNVKKKVDEILNKKVDFMQLKNRVRLKNTVLYCIQQKYYYGSVRGQLVLCFNEEKARINKEKRIDQINKAQALLLQRKPISEGVKRFFNKDFTVNETAIREAQQYDGCSVIFSTKNLVIAEIVKAYFEKDKVEKAFRSMKSVLGLKPIKHWLEERVKSHVFICYLSYLLISLLETKLKKTEITAISALDKLSTAYKVCLKNKKTKNEFEKIVTLTKEQEKIMKAVDKNILKPSV